jgi:hypothetical protein
MEEKDLRKLAVNKSGRWKERWGLSKNYYNNQNKETK